MRAVAHAIGLKYSPLPPYEVMLTDAMSPGELLTAMQLHRYYLFSAADRKILFGYDAENHQPAPVFMALVI